MPDVVDLGEKQFEHKEQCNAIRSNLIKNVHNAHQVLTASKIIENDKKCSEGNNSRTILNKSKEEKTCDDLIYLRGPCTEAALINMLKIRFSKNILQVFLKNYGIIQALFFSRHGLDLYW